MHMADALLSPGVGLTMAGVSAVAVGMSCYQMRKDARGYEKLPLLAMAGAFVFAAQMINFMIPGTGSSGHIGGGILLAALLGPWQALLTLAVVLIIQCLLFADGGILALGCNIFNMAVIPCLVVYPLIGRRWMKKNLLLGTMGTTLISLPIGAFAVVLETQLSGIAELPFGQFTMLMVPIHIAIAIGEGIATAAVLYFVAKMHSEMMDLPANPDASPEFVLSKKAVVAIIGIAALCVGMGISAFASSLPDGLEWAVLNTTGAEELEASGSVYETVAGIQETTSVFPDYELSDASWNSGWLAAFVGVIVTALVAGCIAWAFSKRQTQTNESIS